MPFLSLISLWYKFVLPKNTMRYLQPLLIYERHSLPLSHQGVNSLAPGKCGNNLKNVIPDHMLWKELKDISNKIALLWMPSNTFDDKSTVVQVMACCHQAPSHYLSHCWPRSMASLGQNELIWPSLPDVMCPILSWILYLFTFMVTLNYFLFILVVIPILCH